MEEKKVINISEAINYLLKRKKKYISILLGVIILSCIIIVQVPRTYKCDVSLAPEESNAVTGGSLGALASSFGFDLGSIQSSDAIYPLLYPDLFESTDFIVDLFDIKVATIDGTVKTDYYDYLVNHQETAPWQPALSWFKGLFKSKPKTINNSGGEKGKIVGKKYANGDVVNPFMLTEKQEALVAGVKNNIQCGVDKKTDVITISITDQDPLVSATMADSVSNRLKEFIINYRTSKSRADSEYYSRLTREAKNEYEQAVAKYSEYCDTHKDIILQSFISERDELENDMQIKYNTYSALNTQLQTAKAKVQERTPVFTVLQSASVPVLPNGPKRMIFVAAMAILTCMVFFGIAISKQLNTKQDC